MNISSQMNINSTEAAEQMQSKPPRPQGPPPQGSIPPGLERAVSTLSEEQQSSVTSMLESLSDEQHASLKEALDTLKLSKDQLSQGEVGEVFFEALSNIYNNNSTTNSDNIVDTYV